MRHCRALFLSLTLLLCGHTAVAENKRHLGSYLDQTGCALRRHGAGKMKPIADRVRHGRYLNFQNGSHLALYDDQEVYRSVLLRFIQDVDAGRF